MNGTKNNSIIIQDKEISSLNDTTKTDSKITKLFYVLTIFLVLQFLLSIKMVMPRTTSGYVPLIVGFFLFIGFFAIWIIIPMKTENNPKLMTLLVFLVGVVLLFSISLRIVYIVKKDSAANSFSEGESVYLYIKLDSEFSSDSVSGIVYDPWIILDIDGNSIKGTGIIKLEIGKKYPAKIHVFGSVYGSSLVGNNEITVLVDKNHKSQKAICRCGLVTAKISLSFSRDLSFWDVIFSDISKRTEKLM